MKKTSPGARQYRTKTHVAAVSLAKHAEDHLVLGVGKRYAKRSNVLLPFGDSLVAPMW